MYKIVASDLDETLLGPDGTISEDNIAAIKKITGMGIKFIPNTGRSFESIQPLLDKLGLINKPKEYAIVYNGGAIVENEDNKILRTNPLTFAEAEVAFEILSRFPDTAIHVYLLNDLYIFHPRTDDLAYLKTRGVSYKVFEDHTLAKFTSAEIIKVIAMNPDPAIQKDMHDVVMYAFNSHINCTYSSGQYVEVNSLSVDKGIALIQLAISLDVFPVEIMAIGDNSNDISMLQSVGLPISVRNGVPAVKKNSQYITKGNYINGVAEAINTFILN